jgi:hypothetical protein
MEPQSPECQANAQLRALERAMSLGTQRKATSSKALCITALLASTFTGHPL